MCSDLRGQRTETRGSLRVVRLTPPGRGAIATLLVEGPGAEKLVQARFRTQSGRPLASYAQDQLAFGHYAIPTEEEPSPLGGEEVVIRRHSPESIEIHCHGGFAALDMIQKTLLERGGEVIAWADWVAGHHTDPIAVAARLALAEARTERTARILLDQYEGALRRASEAVRQALDHRDAPSALRQIEALLARARIGRHLVDPWRVVLAGRPNVGKSSLANALLGYSRAIVHPTPGTTRDVVTAVTAIDGWPVELADTAGLRPATEEVEQAGIELARRQRAAADLILLVIDSNRPWSEEDQRLADAMPGALRIHNKVDHLPANRPAAFGGFATSALTGQGIEALLREIAVRLVPDPPCNGAAVPFTPHHVELLEAARVALQRGNMAEASAVLRF